MVRVLVKIPEEARSYDLQGSEKEVAERLRGMFPEESERAYGLKAIIEAILEDGAAEITYEVMKDRPEENLLPEGFLTHNQDDYEDPWQRPS